MSDDPVSAFFTALGEEWRKPRPKGLPKPGVRSRPSFWNPFLSWREVERDNLIALYDAVNAAFEVSPLHAA